MKALDPADFTDTYRLIFNRIVSNDQYKILRTLEFCRIVRDWGDSGNRRAALVLQAIVTDIDARAERRDDSWCHLASSELGVPESVFRDYASQGDNLSLSILIHITCQKSNLLWEWPWVFHEFSIVLEIASKFDVRDTSPVLQHEFCALWNQIVLKAQKDGDKSIVWHILRRIRNVYITLHQGSDAAQAPTRFDTTHDLDPILSEPSSYPLCNVRSHHPDSTPRIHEGIASATIVRSALHDNTALVPASLSSTPNAPSPSVPVPLPVNGSVPLLGGRTPVPVSFRPAHPTTVKDHHILVTSSDPTAANASRGGVDTSARTVPYPTPETSPPPPLASTSPPGAVTHQHNADSRTSSDVPTIPPGTPQPASAVPGLGTATERGGGNVKGILHKDKDALGPPSVNHTKAMVTPDLPLQSPT
ncbi:hypothetical protein EDB87DRAFT_1576439 [Lactarius vividus]|nr:hypothetical protein EDB87DRAFT_1576439 [Lactarius vividus]